MRFVTSKREKWFAIQTIPETIDGFDWAPFDYIYRSYFVFGCRIWWKLLAKRQLDQFVLIKRAGL